MGDLTGKVAVITGAGRGSLKRKSIMKDLKADMFKPYEASEITVVLADGKEVSGTLDKVICYERTSPEFQQRDPFTLEFKLPPDEKLCDGTHTLKIGELTVEGAYISRSSPVGEHVYFSCSFN